MPEARRHITIGEGTREEYVSRYLTRAHAPSDEPTCPICSLHWEENNSGVVVTHCSHYFHKDCILQWMNGEWEGPTDSCPCCRTEFFKDPHTQLSINPEDRFVLFRIREKLEQDVRHRVRSYVMQEHVRTTLSGESREEFLRMWIQELAHDLRPLFPTEVTPYVLAIWGPETEEQINAILMRAVSIKAMLDHGNSITGINSWMEMMQQLAIARSDLKSLLLAHGRPPSANQCNSVAAFWDCFIHHAAGYVTPIGSLRPEERVAQFFWQELDRESLENFGGGNFDCRRPIIDFKVTFDNGISLVLRRSVTDTTEKFCIIQEELGDITEISVPTDGRVIRIIPRTGQTLEVTLQTRKGIVY